MSETKSRGLTLTFTAAAVIPSLSNGQINNAAGMQTTPELWPGEQFVFQERFGGGA